MKKKYVSFLAFASLLSFSVCTQSCNNDDEDENANEQKVQQQNSQEAAANIASRRKRIFRNREKQARGKPL